MWLLSLTHRCCYNHGNQAAFRWSEACSSESTRSPFLSAAKMELHRGFANVRPVSRCQGDLRIWCQTHMTWGSCSEGNLGWSGWRKGHMIGLFESNAPMVTSLHREYIRTTICSSQMSSTPTSRLRFQRHISDRPSWLSRTLCMRSSHMKQSTHGSMIRLFRLLFTRSVESLLHFQERISWEEISKTLMKLGYGEDIEEMDAGDVGRKWKVYQVRWKIGVCTSIR